QAEDGIRDFHVTGVQTCALPIYRQRRIRFRCISKHVHLMSYPPGCSKTHLKTTLRQKPVRPDRSPDPARHFLKYSPPAPTPVSLPQYALSFSCPATSGV